MRAVGICVFLAALPAFSNATCIAEDADKIYRAYAEESAKIKSSEDTAIFRFLSARTLAIAQDSISRLTAEVVSPEDLKKYPVLGNKLEIRKRLAVMALKSRSPIPADESPVVSETVDGITLRYAWKSSREEYEEREKIPVQVVTDHKDEVVLVCQGEWKVDSEKHELKNEVFTKEGAAVKNSYMGGGATYAFPIPENGPNNSLKADSADASRP